MSDDCSDWSPYGPRGLDAMLDMSATLNADGLLTPVVPRHLAPSRLTWQDGWAWATTSRWSPWAGYILDRRNGPRTLPAALAPDVDDFWLFAQRGSGMGSHGIGMVAKIGPLMIAQSQAYGGFFGDWDVSRSRVNRATQAWGRTAAELVEFDMSGPARHLVVFSDFRDESLVATSDFEYVRDSSPNRYLPDGWGIVADLCDQTDDEEPISELHAIDDPVLAIALRHLAALRAADRPAASEDDES